MKDKEKQLANDLAEIFDKEYQKRGLLTPIFTAKQLCELGYQKVNEGSVVLSKEEWEQTDNCISNLRCLIDKLNDDLREVRKESVKEILMACEKYEDVFQGRFALFLAWMRTNFGVESGVKE